MHPLLLSSVSTELNTWHCCAGQHWWAALVGCIGKNPTFVRDLLHLHTMVHLLSHAHDRVPVITALQKAVPPPKPSHLFLSSQHGPLVPPLSLQLCFLEMPVTGLVSIVAFSDWLFSISNMHLGSSKLLHDCIAHFYHWIIFHCTNVPQFVYLFTH